MTRSEKSSRIFNKIVKIIGYIFLAMLLAMLLFDIFAIILMVVKSIFGYCAPWMSKIINFELSVLEQMRDIPW